MHRPVPLQVPSFTEHNVNVSAFDCYNGSGSLASSVGCAELVPGCSCCQSGQPVVSDSRTEHALDGSCYQSGHPIVSAGCAELALGSSLRGGGNECLEYSLSEPDRDFL